MKCDFAEKYWKDSVYSDGSLNYLSCQSPSIGDKVRVRLRLLKNAPVNSIYLRYTIDGTHSMVPMSCAFKKNGLNYYEAVMPIGQNRMVYSFMLLGDGTFYYYTQAGLTDYIQNESSNFVILADYVQPAWVKNSVFYQIFPERFCNGDPANDVRDGEITKMGHKSIQVRDWNQVPGRYEDTHCLDFYGGDLQGIKSKIPYLKELGVTALYINPLFTGPSVHKYDCIDYEQIDPHFGGDEALKELSEALHENGMKLVLDISINHTGTDHKWFNKDGVYYDKSTGAYNNPDSEERSFYVFNEDGSYNYWRGAPDLPQLNYRSDVLREKLYRGEDSVLKKWLKPPYSIDGWRFDVADVMAKYGKDQLSHEVWREIRKEIRSVNPNAFIMAEEWGECSEYMQGDEWDSTMDYYGCARIWRSFIGDNDWVLEHIPKYAETKHKYNALQAKSQMLQFLSRLPFIIQQNLYNLMDSHDMDRLHNNPVCFGDYRGAVIAQFTMIGTPSIYYGDEAGIDGRIEDMEGCRYPMPWGSGFEESEQYKLHKMLSHLRQEHKVFAEGSFQFIYCLDQVISFARYDEEECFLSVINSSDTDTEAELPVGVLGITQDSDHDGNHEILGQYELDSIGHKDTLGMEFKGSYADGVLKLELPAHTSYLIEL